MNPKILELEVKNIASLLDGTRRFCLGFGKTAYWFRGHANAEWNLVAAVHREYDTLSERNLTGRFVLGAPTRCARCPVVDDLPAWLCLMQHFGLPTRLLDWSRSLLAAVYFAAAYTHYPGPGAVWILVPSELNQLSSFKFDGTFILHGPEPAHLVAAAFNGGMPSREVVATFGQDVDVRMSVQQGAFTLHGDPSPLESREDANRFLAKLIIPESAKRDFEDELWVLGIHRSTLFPDLANLAFELANDRRLIPKRGLPKNDR